MGYTSTVLIVDDEPGGRETLRGLLLTQGYTLAFAANGAEALAKAAELTPDVILLDVMMPGMDGFETCRRLRADPQLREAPVIMVTALDDRDSRVQGIEAGADDFVSKPFDRAELRARVKTITRLNRYRRLHAERARFQRVVEHADAGYVLVDDRDRILYANPCARRYLDLSPDGEVADTFMEAASKHYHCEPQQAWADWPEPCLDAARYLVRPESPTAHTMWLCVETLDVPPSGPGEGRLISLRDVTGQMVARREMWTFQSMLSHKLRTPLGHMISGLDALAIHVDKLSPDEIAGLAATTLKGVQRLNHSIDDIFRYMRAPVLAAPGDGFNLSELQPLVTRIGAELGLDEVTLHGESALHDVQIALSPRALESALWEIMENAKKFHPKHSPKVAIDVAGHKPREVSLRFADDGMTLSPEQLSKAWLPFYQGEKYFTGEVAGMGLGLSMVALMMWAVGGACRIYNRETGPGVVVELLAPQAG
jgi:DNA-binding response OmpR family regulator